MSQSLSAFFAKGPNSTVQLAKGYNLSYESTGLAIYNSTEIDRWQMGDFISAEYIINAEFGQNERETIHATLVAMPGQTTITIYGRTSLTRQLINLRSNATNSYAQLIAEPASIGVQGIVVTFLAQYARASQPLKPLNAPAVATGCSWTSTTGTSLTITVPTNSITGIILVGQLVQNSNLPNLSTVQSWNSTTGVLVVGGFASTAIAAQASQQLKFITSVGEVTNRVVNAVAPGFNKINIANQPSINSTSISTYLNLSAGTGIGLVTAPSTNSLTIQNQALLQVTVPGQATIDSTVSKISSLNLVAADHMILTTNPTTNQLTISSSGVTVTADDSTSITSTNFKVQGSGAITTSTSNGNLVIYSPTYNLYNQISDNNGNVSTALTSSGSFKIVAGKGVSAVVTAQSPTYGDSVVIANTGVTSIGGSSGDITTTSLLALINSAVGSISLPIGQYQQSTGQFTTLASAGLTVNGTANLPGTNAAVASVFQNIVENVNVIPTFPTLTTTVYINTGAVIYFTSNASTNWSINIAFSSSTTLNAVLAVGQAITIAVLVTQGSVAYYNTSVSVDGLPGTVTTYWQGGTAPTRGNPTGIDVYTYTIIKTAATPSYIVLAGLTQY